MALELIHQETIPYKMMNMAKTCDCYGTSILSFSQPGRKFSLLTLWKNIHFDSALFVSYCLVNTHHRKKN